MSELIATHIAWMCGISIPKHRHARFVPSIPTSFMRLRKHYPDYYKHVEEIDHLPQDKKLRPPMKLELFMIKSCKRLDEMTPEDCNDGEFFDYCGQQIWNGF